MRADESDIRRGQVAAAETYRVVRAVWVGEQHQCALFGLVEPLVRGDRDRIGDLDPVQQAGVAGQSQRAGPCGVHVPPRRPVPGVERIDGAGGDRAGGEHQHRVGEVIRQLVFA